MLVAREIQHSQLQAPACVTGHGPESILNQINTKTTLLFGTAYEQISWA